MPLSATYNDIKAYQDQVEKNQITPHGLPPCPRCHLESLFFKLHAYRDRRFLIIVEMLVKAVFCTLVRFKCPDCGKTITHYPDFAIPHKHYTRQTIESLSRSYVEDHEKTYEEAVVIDEGVPERSDSGRTLSPSSVHRWISTTAELIRFYCKNTTAKSFEDHGPIKVPERKYKTQKRRDCLFLCRWFFKTIENPFFTEFAMGFR